MTAKVILNPYSGRGKASRMRQALETGLHEAGVEFELVATKGPLQAIDLAASAAEQGFSPILAAGGDGLIGEVVNGLGQSKPSGPLGPLGVIPLGTANDLANNLGLPMALHEAVAAISTGHKRRIDLGRAGDWLFANNSALGLEPVVTMYNAEMVRLRGVIRYLVAALRAIVKGPSYQVHLTWDEGEYKGPTTLISVGNNPVTGGLFCMAPAADPADGLLTFVYGYAPNRGKMLALLPRTLNGSYVDDPAIHQHHTRRLFVRADTPMPLQVDGELRGTGVHRITFETQPDRLEILVPASASDPPG